jgi:predicted enzyme related to lactoylglutathione lyase
MTNNYGIGRTTAIALATVLALAMVSRVWPAAASHQIEPGRFIWHDLMTRDLAGAKQFYGALFNWEFTTIKRNDRPYVLAKTAGGLVGGIVDVSAIQAAAPQWLSFMAVANVNQAVEAVRAEGGMTLAEPRDLPIARVAVVVDPQGAPLGLAELRREVLDRATPIPNHFFWQEYLARDTTKALAFYRGLGGYEATVVDARLGIEYHLLRTTRPHAGLFNLPDGAVGVLPNWLPYVFVTDPAAVAARAQSLGGRILVPASPDRRGGSLVVIADPGGAPLALQKIPF